MSKIDYALKAYILNEHEELLKMQRRCSKYEYAKNLLYEDGIISYALTHKDDYLSSMQLMNYAIENDCVDLLRECSKINHATYKRTQRLKDRIRAMLLNGSCIFLTLTFNDDTINNTTAKQRRVAVSRYLKQYNCMYVANIDFGKLHNREHYHALINCKQVEYQGWKKYGSIDFERVKNKDIETDNIRLSKYISKLSNHAVKETTKRSTLIYSR